MMKPAVTDTIATRRETTEGRRLEIALAARALIVEKGFEGLRTRDIADRVGINVATLHYHVPSKEALIGLVAESMRDEFVAQHLSRPRGTLTPLELLRLEFIDLKETFETNPDLLKVFSELVERGRRDTRIQAAARTASVSASRNETSSLVSLAGATCRIASSFRSAGARASSARSAHTSAMSNACCSGASSAGDG